MAENEKKAEDKKSGSSGIFGNIPASVIAVIILILIAAISGYWYGIQKERTRQEAIEHPAHIVTKVIERVRTEYKDRVVIEEKIVEGDVTIPVVPAVAPAEKNKTVALHGAIGWNAYGIGAEYYLLDWISVGPYYWHIKDTDRAVLGITVHF